MSNVVMNIGMLISPVVVGWLFDVQGTYRYGMLGLGFIAMAGGTMALFATRPRPPVARTVQEVDALPQRS
jgi:hypothetical protein